MDRISGLSDDLLVKILSSVPTKLAVSTSVLSKRWKCLWTWVPTLEYDDMEDITDIYFSDPSFPRYRVHVHKNLLSNRAPIIETLRLKFCLPSLQPEDIKQWVDIAVSRSVRALSITCLSDDVPVSALPSSLYTCETLVSLKLEGSRILVDVPPTTASCLLPSLTALQLLCVTYSNEDSLRLFLSYCPVLEDLAIERDSAEDNVKGLVVAVPSLQRLSLQVDGGCSYDDDECVIDTPSLTYFKVEDYRDGFSYSIKDMPKLEEADIAVKYELQPFLESVTSVKSLSIKVRFNNEEESMYCSCIVFNQLQRLKLSICSDDWSKLLFRLLNDSPKLRVLNLDCASRYPCFYEYEYGRISRENNEWSVIPNCLLKTLETFEFTGCKGRPQEREFLSFFFENARCLKSTSILR